ncbi:hypothetical protein [Nocardia macrotermitis]|uniref:Integral membrane protein n=1 Tax=Nocardia macrotermitis TaxID=2585198 RepID=A0A7K0D2T9_9NOCA|nr:hypothetical protein [Nocardia macrotermitis]MQY20028.1 hypothetical protein [Nocardia macrotermitis]
MQNSDGRDDDQVVAQGDVPTVVPNTVRGAGALAALEGVAGVIVAIVLVVRGLSGVDQSKVSAYGTAAWFLILGAAVLAAGIGLFRGRRWGRAIAVIAQVLLLPVAWYMLEGGQAQFGIPLGLVALAGLGLLFAPPSSRWMAQGYDSSIGSAG